MKIETIGLIIIGIIAFFRALEAALGSSEKDSSLAVFIAEFIVNAVGITLFLGLVYLVVMVGVLAVQHVMG